MVRDTYLDEVYDIIAVQGVGGFLGLACSWLLSIYTHADSIVWNLRLLIWEGHRHAVS